ncbi:hypothetical protein T05_13025 [Trichinella murrelli]|uniref:Uncharacterized protein n=1 Tax=Trichinella murrelli TaxID=144512 RepID=A0A0V0TMB7_9BILA|nr:hypothetical protein T05_13025 [Trichinella murrelli]
MKHYERVIDCLLDLVKVADEKREKEMRKGSVKLKRATFHGSGHGSEYCKKNFGKATI